MAAATPRPGHRMDPSQPQYVPPMHAWLFWMWADSMWMASWDLRRCAGCSLVLLGNLQTPSFSLPTESAVEVPGLSAMLEDEEDIRVSLSHVHWSWSEANPFPPLEAVLATPFWSWDKYAEVREQLRRPTPVIEVTIGNDYITVDTAGGECRAPEGAVQPAEPSEPAPKPKPGHGAAHLRSPMGLNPSQSQQPVRSWMRSSAKPSGQCSVGWSGPPSPGSGRGCCMWRA